MFKSLKKVLTLAAAAGLMFTACNGNAGFEATDADFPAASRSASTESNTVRIYSDLNPGFGNAVYFSGSFDAANTWTTAVRGSYDNGWYADVEASSTFEWKALTGAYSLGETTAVSNLSWEAGENHVYTIEVPYEKQIYVLTQKGYGKYGQVCYFTGTFDEGKNWTEAVKGTYNWITYKWYAVVEAYPDFEWKTLTGFGDKGEVYAAPFEGLNWAAGANSTAADAELFSEYFAENVVIDYASIQFSDKTGKVSVFSNNLISGIDLSYESPSDTIVELRKGEEVLWSGKLFITGNSMTVPYDFEKTDTAIYTVAVSPVSRFGDKGKEKTYDFSPAMVLVSGNTFTMGNDSDSYSDNPEHKVTLTKSIWASKYEVTQKEFVDLMGDNPAKNGYENRYGDELPVYYISFPLAVIYCNKKSAAEGLEPVYNIPGFDWVNIEYNYNTWWKVDLSAFEYTTVNAAANGYRLPTEAEWEYLARANRDYKYSGSDSYEEVAGTCGSSGYTTFENVGSYKANSFGLYNMTGNVAEFCFDFYGAYDESNVTDPTGPASGTKRVSRGGGCKLYMGWNYEVYGRNSISLTGSAYDQGFRVVRNAL